MALRTLLSEIGYRSLLCAPVAGGRGEKNDEVVREAPELLGAEAAVIRVLEDDELVARAAHGHGTQGIVGSRTSSASGVAGVVAQSRAPLTVGDARETPRFAREDSLLRLGHISVVAVP